MKKKNINLIFSTTGIAGSLDILAAFLLNGIILDDTPPKIILQYIASPVFPDSFKEGWVSAFTGLLIHFLIAFFFTLLYFFIYSLKIFKRIPILLAAFFYGNLVWTIMNLFVIPTAFKIHYTFVWKDYLIQSATLIFMLALPIVWRVRFLERK